MRGAAEHERCVIKSLLLLLDTMRQIVGHLELLQGYPLLEEVLPLLTPQGVRGQHHWHPQHGGHANCDRSGVGVVCVEHVRCHATLPEVPECPIYELVQVWP